MTGNTSFRLAGVALLALLAHLGAPDSASAGPVEKAKELAGKGRWAEAAAAYAKVLDGGPNRDAAIGLTEAAVKAGKPDLYQVAEDALFALREKDANDWDVRIALGDISLAIAATKTDTLALKSYNAEAQRNYEAARRGAPSSERAAVGLARTHFGAAFFQQAADAIDAYLAGSPTTTADALFWKGQAYYFLPQDTFTRAGGTYPLGEDAAGYFRKAQGAYLASAKENATNFQTWMQYAYASQYLGDTAAAREGYVQAIPLDAESDLPLRGLEALFAHEKEKLPPVLEALVKEHPQHAQLLFHLGKNRYEHKDYQAAIKALKAHVKVAKQPGQGWNYLGLCYEAETEDDKALDAYREALKASPGDRYAASKLEARIRKDGSAEKVRQSPKAAQEVIAQYEAILKIAPDNTDLRNNLAFQLREAYVAHQGSKKWIPILKEATRLYVEATKIIGEWSAQKERTMTPQQRHEQAQVISDTALMFQFYEPTRDYARAEELYNRALEFSDNGYRDAFINLARILEETKRWQDLYDLASVCADSVVSQPGQPDEQARGIARQIMKRLVAEKKVSD